jgi:sulfite reductase (NADPH) flavoprotein alpha-component
MTTATTSPGIKPAALAAAVVPVLPESAPFSAAQRAWLNGFFAGIVGTQGGTAAAAQAPAPAVAAVPAPAPVAEPAAVEEDFPWHDPTIPLAERLKLADERPYPRKLMAAMAQLDCGACGYVCQFYAEAIASGEEKDLTRCTPGGRDTSKALKQLVTAAPANFVASKDVGVQKAKAAPSADAPAAWDRNNPFPARLVQSQKLNGPASDKDTRHVVIDLRGSGITYKPGDALGVYPQNCADLAAAVVEALGASGAEDVPGWDGQDISLYEALRRDYTITRPTPDLLDLLARTATSRGDREALEALRDSDDGAGDLQVLDLLTRFASARPSPGDVVATLSPLAPRLYSISSSLRAHPDQVHLTVGAVRYKNSTGRACHGVASTFLAGRVRPGQRVRVFIHASHKFGLPADGDKPVIMVGPGTGIAPFRAFLHERAAADMKGKNWLFFGDQRSSCDALYADELAEFTRSGVLTRLDCAYSRDQQEKVYVQHRMLENAAELWRWLQEGAHFYVCGDAKRMAADVDAALRRVVAEQGGLGTAEVDAFVSDLVRSGRYQRDVY